MLQEIPICVALGHESGRKANEVVEMKVAVNSASVLITVLGVGDVLGTVAVEIPAMKNLS